MAVWTDSEETQPASSDNEDRQLARALSSPAPETTAPEERELPQTETPFQPLFKHGWPIPSSIIANPEEARACIQLPEFVAFLLEKARVISGRFPFAEEEFRSQRGKEPSTDEPEIP